MSFKKSVLMILLFATQIGCSWWGGESRDNSVLKLDEREILGNSASCIDELGSFFSNYFSGTTTSADIQRNFGCVLKTVNVIFENAVEKDPKQGFAREEINQILISVFPKKDEAFINDQIEILFLVKRIFVGGHQNGFSRKDYVEIKKVLPLVAIEFARSSKDIRHLFFGTNLTHESRNEGFLQLTSSFKALDNLRDEYGGELTEGEGSSLVEYIFGNEGLAKFKSLAFVAKTFVYNDDPQVFLRSQRDFFERLIRVFEIQARLRALDFNKGFLFGKSYYDLETAVLMTSQSLLKWAELDSRWHIDVDSFSEVLKAFTDAGFLADMFSDPELVSLSVEKLFTRVFEKEKLDFESMERLNDIFLGWASRQENIISKYNFQWILKNKFLNIDLESKNIVEEVESFKFPQFVSELNAPIIIKRDGNSLVPAELYFDQSLKHLLISIANEVFKAYSSVQPFTKGSPSKRLSLRLPEVTRIFDDVRPLGLEFGFNDPHHCGSQKRVLMEADSLTLSGNGDNSVSIKESVEWLATMISVATVSNRVFKRIEESCSLPGMEVLGSPFMDRSCALNQLAGNDRILTDHFPQAFSYVDMLKSETRRKSFEKQLGGLIDWFDRVDYKKESATDFLKNRFNSSNTCSDKTDFPFSKREFNTSFAINIYVENLYYQFDKTGVDSWLPGTSDPKGADFIIDGKELSNFLKTKMSGLLDVLVPVYKRSHFSTRFLSNDRVKKILESLPENANYFDRSRVVQLLELFLSVDEEDKRHPYSNQYCDDVSRTQKSGIFYRKEDRLMCLPEDMSFF